MDRKRKYIKKTMKKYKNGLITIDKESKEKKSMKQNEIEELNNVIEHLSNKNDELK